MEVPRARDLLHLRGVSLSLTFLRCFKEMQEGSNVSEKMVFRARERKERNMNLDCKCSFINFYTGIPFQCLANEFKLLFMRAFFPIIEVFFFKYSDQENSV